MQKQIANHDRDVFYVDLLKYFLVLFVFIRVHSCSFVVTKAFLGN